MPHSPNRRDCLALGLAALLAETAAVPALADPRVGKPAPDFAVTTLDGGRYSANTLRGKVVLLNFWATWCLPCRAEMPTLDAYYRAHKAQGLEILAISQDEARRDDQVRKVADTVSYPVAFARDASYHGYGRIWSLPLSFVIDRSGVLRIDGSRHPFVFDAAGLERTVTPLLAQKV